VDEQRREKMRRSGDAEEFRLLADAQGFRNKFGITVRQKVVTKH